MLLILVQAWSCVKKMPVEPSADPSVDGGLPGWPDGVPLPKSVRAWLGPSLRADNLRVEDAAWQRSLASPLLAPSPPCAWQGTSALAKAWGKPHAPYLETLEEIIAWSPPAEDLPSAVALRWSSDWERSLPGPVVALLERAHQLGVPVWMRVPALLEGPALSEEVLRRSTQVGWSWWCDPPASASQLPAWFQAFRPAWGFWLCAPASDQWAWPWMDMTLYSLSRQLGARGQERPWVTDSRQRAAWARLEAEAWTRAREVLGSAEVADALMAQVLARLVKEVPSIR
jgi:hypothetical protein